MTVQFFLALTTTLTNSASLICWSSANSRWPSSSNSLAGRRSERTAQSTTAPIRAIFRNLDFVAYYELLMTLTGMLPLCWIHCCCPYGIYISYIEIHRLCLEPPLQIFQHETEMSPYAMTTSPHSTVCTAAFSCLRASFKMAFCWKEVTLAIHLNVLGRFVQKNVHQPS